MIPYQKRPAQPLKLVRGVPKDSGATLAQVGDFAWRRDKGLLTLSDHARLYGMQRVPRGKYTTPLPGDLIAR